MPDEYIKIGKVNYRHFYSYSEKDKAEAGAKRLRKEGKLVRILKKTFKMTTEPKGKETTYYVYYCTSRRR